MTKHETAFWKAMKRISQLELDHINYDLYKVAEDTGADVTKIKIWRDVLRKAAKKEKGVH